MEIMQKQNENRQTFASVTECDCGNVFHDCDERDGCRMLKRLSRGNSIQTTPAVPIGWKIVPEDPDDEMIDSACDASGAYRVDFVRAYTAALAKAPQPLDLDARQQESTASMNGLAADIQPLSEEASEAKERFWIVMHNADTNETGLPMNKTFIKTTWEGFPAQQNEQAEIAILEDVCLRRFGKKVVYVQGVAACAGWVLHKSTLEEYRAAQPHRWGGYPTQTMRLELGIGNSGKVNCYVDEEVKLGSGKS